jgi:hypothetical protein
VARRRTTALAISAAVAVILPAVGAAAAEPGPIERVSVAAGTVNGDPDGESSRALVSGDGRFTVFQSEADNLVTGDPRKKTVPWTDVFRVDNQTKETVMIGSRPGGLWPDNQSTFPAASGNGCFVAFQSQASNLAAPTTDLTSPDVFRQDMCSAGRPIEQVSVKPNGADAGGQSTRPSISDDGRWVAFNSSAPLAAGDSGSSMDAYLRDMSKAPGEAGWVYLISTAPDGTDNEDSIRAIVSGDGSYVTFVSDSALVPSDTNGKRDVYRWHRETRTMALVSVRADGKVNNSTSTRPWIDGDGDTVVFQTIGVLTSPETDTNGNDDVFTATFTGPSDLRPDIRRVSVRPDGSSTTGASTRIQISGDGTVAVFASNDPRLASGDRNRQRDVFRADLVTGTITRVSQNLAGGDENCPDTTGEITLMARPGAPQMSSRPDVSNDGSVVMFVSGSCTLVHGDDNGLDDMFIRYYTG